MIDASEKKGGIGMNGQDVKVTQKQNEYLVALKDSPKTTNWLMRAFMVTTDSAGRIIKQLREGGLVESTRAEGIQGNVLIHSLITPYVELVKNGLIVTNYNKSIPIMDDEILYVAILRNAGLTGQQLPAQYRKVHPNRSAAGIKNIVMTARKRRLCR